MNDDLTLLASAYLDGDVTADERARVESTPELLAEVERLRSVATLLADVEPPRISLREQQLANALDAWDRLPEAERRGTNRDSTPRAMQRGVNPATLAGAASITAPPSSLADRRRTTMNRRLLGAAAAIIVVLGGGIALQTLTRGSTDDSSSDAGAAELDADAPEAAALAAAPESEQAADEPTANLAADAGEGQTDSTELDTGILDPAPPPDRELEQLNTPEELGIFAADAVEAPESPDVPAATSAPLDDVLTDTQRSILEAEFPLCLGADYVVGPARYGEVDVVVGVDESRDLAIAYQPVGCREVARARLP